MRIFVDYAHKAAYAGGMARLNIYIPEDLHKLAARMRSSQNLSAICVRALREELEAADDQREAKRFLGHLAGPRPEERALARKLGLREAVISETPDDASELRNVLGQAAAAYLDRTLADGALIGIAGGRQSWCVVKSLSPRRLLTTITALGVSPTDPRVLQAHPNTLATLMYLLFTPRADVHLVGSDATQGLWDVQDQEEQPDVARIVMGSCGPFDSKSPFSTLLGSAVVTQLAEKNVLGDFCGIFLREDGPPLLPPLPAKQASFLSPEQLSILSSRRDSRVLLIAGGEQKLALIRATIRARLCNVLITDEETAGLLIGE